MRTALILLFLLALGAIPGAILPQRSLNESKVTSYIQENGKLGQLYDKLELFDVFSSKWFTAIYVLLFISLIGCILPRTWEHYKAMRAKPVRAPKNLSRLPHYRQVLFDHNTNSAPSSSTTAPTHDEIRSIFKRWHGAETAAADDRAGAWSYAAERGYAREFCNLVFHIGLTVMLVLVAVGRLVYYEGQVIVIAGNQNSQFCNSAVANFDSFRNGPLVDGTKLAPFCVQVNNFKADYLANGQAKMFTSDIKYATKNQVNEPVSDWTNYQLKVNHPLRIEGDRIYLQGHGFAPKFTVTWPNGESRTQEIQWQPTDMTNFLSAGVMRFDPPAGMYSDLQERRKNQIAIQGLLAPTAQFTGDNNNILTSSFPTATDPAVAIDVYRGDVGLDSGVGQSLFNLDMGLIHSGELKKQERVNLKQGETTTLPDGTKVKFDGVQEFVNLQISHDPTQGWLLGVAIIMLLGLVGSVSIKRRRMWVRITEKDGGTLVEVAGLARTDRAGWGKEFGKYSRTILRLPEDDEDSDEDSDE